MKISYQWLGDFVDLDVDVGALSDLLRACRRQPHAVAEQHAEQRPGTTSRHACGRRAASRSPSGSDHPLLFSFARRPPSFGKQSGLPQGSTVDYGLRATG